MSYGSLSDAYTITGAKAKPAPTTLSVTYTGSTSVGTVVEADNWSYTVKDQYGQNMDVTGSLQCVPSGIALKEGNNTFGLSLFLESATLRTEAVVLGVPSGSTSSSGTAQGTNTKKFSNIVQDNAVTNPTSITFTSQNETKPSGGDNRCYKAILTKEGDNWKMEGSRFVNKNSPVYGETNNPYATVTISDGIVTDVTLPKFQSGSIVVNFYTVDGYTYTMEVSS